MHKRVLRNSLTSLLIGGAVFFSSCSLSKMAKLAEESELEVIPCPLELHGDSVKCDVTCILPLKMLKKNKLYTVEVYYQYGNDSLSLGEVEFSPADFPDNKIQQPELRQTFCFAYDPAYKVGELKAIGRASNLDKTKFKAAPPFSLAPGIITTSRLARLAGEALYIGHGYNNKEEIIPSYVDFYFDRGRSTLKRSEVSSERGKYLDAYIAAKNATRSVKIIGSHSPEGLESINEKLSLNRAKVMQDFYYNKMKAYDYKNLADSIKFETAVQYQDWSPFQKAIEKDETLTSAQKQEVLNTIASTQGTYFEKEKALQKLTSYKYILNNIYPSLRVSKIEILTVKPKKSDAEMSVLAKQIVDGKCGRDTLNFDEIMYAAVLTPLLDEKEAIYKAATKYPEESWKAHNNLGVVYLLKALRASDQSGKDQLIASANTQFDLASASQQSAIVSNNVAVASLMAGDKDKAIASYEKASSLSPDAILAKSIKAGTGSIQLLQGRYAQAVASLEAANDTVANNLYNLGLAYILNKNYSNAVETLFEASKLAPKDAQTYYVLAIANARLGFEEEVIENLQKAFKLDSTLKVKAREDLEFLKFRNSDVFQQIFN